MMKHVNELVEIIVGPELTLMEVLGKLNSSDAPLLLVVDDSGELLGTISDGDVRRALLRGVTVNDQVRNVMKETPVTGGEHSTREQMQILAQNKGVRQIPVVDQGGRLLGMYDFLRGYHQNSAGNTAVIMCGGLGSRMGSLTLNCPKSMLEVGGKPILEQIILNLAASGITKIFLAINHLGHMVEGHFGNGFKWGVDIQYLRETKPLGTGGSLSLLPRRPERPFLLMNGDIFTHFNPLRLLDFHSFTSAVATVGIVEYKYENPYGVINYDGSSFISIEEKPTSSWFINAGIYVLSPEILSLVPPETKMHVPELLQTAKAEGHEVSVCPICEYWTDIGREDDYRRLQRFIATNPPRSRG